MVTAPALPQMAARTRCIARARLMLVILLAWLPLPALHAQANRYEGLLIRNVKIEPQGDVLAPSELAEKLSALKVGAPLAMADVRISIERLYATGRYDDIEVDARESGDGVDLTFNTKPASFVRNVTVVGVVEPPSRGQLVNATKLELGEPFSEGQARQSVENLLEVLRSNGFYLAKVTPEITPAPVQQVDLSFNADTGDRAKYSEPVIKGSPNKETQEIINATRWKRWFGILGWREMTETRTQQGLDRIRRRYQKKEYLMARVTLDQMEYNRAENRVTPVLTIESGPKVIRSSQGGEDFQRQAARTCPDLSGANGR